MKSRYIVVITLLVLLLQGCVHNNLGPLIRTEALIGFSLVDELTPPQPSNVVGYTLCDSNNICTIQLLKDYYPECAPHELFHVFNGGWHGNTPTGCKYGSNFR